MTAADFEPEAIPDELKERDQWLLWDASNDSPRQPHWRGDFGISWSDPDDWHSFDEAVEAASERESWGIGYVTAADNDDHPRGIYGVIDLDGVVDPASLDGDGEPAPKEWVPSLQPFFDRDAYLEYSPSMHEADADGGDSDPGIHVPVAGVDEPEWWTDQHFTDDDHEGAEVLTNKFCTFTGNALEGAGDAVVDYGPWLDDLLAELYEAITGDDPREQTDLASAAATAGTTDGIDATASPATGDATPTDASGTPVGDEDEWMTEADVREALDHINPDVAYPTWRNVGFALADFFDDRTTARRIFKGWSRGGAKWDDDAPAKADRIIDDDAERSTSNPVGIGTVVSLAQQGGWDMSTCPSALEAREARENAATADGGATTASPPADDETAPAPATDAYAGPPEPVVRDGRVYITRPTLEGDVTETPLGRWKCEQCGAVTDAGPVVVGTEYVDPPDECHACEAGPFTHVALEGPTDLSPEMCARPPWTYRPANVDETPLDGLGDVFDDIYGFIYDHWDATEDEVYAGLTAYAVSTWVRDRLEFVPHLMLMGKHIGGKTRLENTLARVSYRPVVAASATPASMFRMIDAYDVSFYVSEYHGLAYEARQELDGIIRAGQKRGEVATRAEQTSEGYDPVVFDPFTHIIVATQYEPPDDIISRCVRIQSSPANRDMPATFDEAAGRSIRDRLLSVRYQLLASDAWADAEADAYEYLAERGIVARTREKLLALVTVAILADRLDDLDPFVDAVVEQDREAAADTDDARVVAAIRDLALDEAGNVSTLGDATVGDDSDLDARLAAVEIPLSDVVDRYNTETGRDKSASWAGQVRSRLGIDKARKRDGTVVSDDDLGPKLRRLCRENNLEFSPDDVHSIVTELDEDDQHRATCSECGELEWLTHKHSTERYNMCEDCADVLADD